MKTPQRHRKLRLAGGRVQPLIMFVAVLCAIGSASVSGPSDVPARVVRALGARHPALLVGRLERSLPPESYLDLAAPPSPEELAQLRGYMLPNRPEPEPEDTQVQSDYVDLWERKAPFPPRWKPR